MSGVGGTYRGTPTRGGGRGQLPFENSPSSIPRPKLDPSSAQSSDIATSTLSSSRQKQSKRDEVSYYVGLKHPIRSLTHLNSGNQAQNGSRPQQEEARSFKSPTYAKSS